MKDLLAKLGQIILPRHRSRRMKALAIVSPQTDREKLERGCQAAGLSLTVTDSWEAALGQLATSPPIPVVLYDATRADRPWSEAADRIEDARGNPSLILLTEGIDPLRTPELRDWGGYDILGSPLDEKRIESAVRIAWIMWKNHTALRQALSQRGGGGGGRTRATTR